MRHPIPLPAVLAAALSVAALAGCHTRRAAAAIPRRTFVRANVELRSVPDTAAKGDSLRRAALRRQGVSEADLRRFLEVHRSPEYLASVWREVADSVQRRWEMSFPSMAERHGVNTGRASPPVGIPGTESSLPLPAPGGPPPLHQPPLVRPPDARRPLPPPDQPPPPATERPRPMVRPPRSGLPPDARGPTTVAPAKRPVPLDSL
jgi:hypothetical protein